MRVTFWHRLSIIATTVIAVLVLLSIVIYMLRQPIASRLIQHYSHTEDLKVSCIDFAFHVELSLHIKKLCLDSPAFKLKVSNARWAYSSNELIIDELRIKHLLSLPGANDAAKQPPSIDLSQFTLSPKLPSLRVKQFWFDSPNLTQPLHLNIQQPKANSLIFGGDIPATVRLEDGLLTLNSQWTVATLLDKLTVGREIINRFEAVFLQPAFANRPIKSTLTFNGQQLTSQHQLNLGLSYPLNPDCQLTGSSDGQIAVEFDLSTTKGTVDLSQLHSQLSLAPDCMATLKLTELFLPSQLRMHFPLAISIDAHTLAVPQIVINDGPAQRFELDIQQLSYTLPQNDTPDVFQGDFSLDIKLADPSQANQTLSFSTAGHGQYGTNDWQLDIPKGKLNVVDFNYAGAHIVKAELGFNAKLSKLEGLTLNGQGQVNNLRYLKDAQPALSFKNLSSHFSVTASSPAQISLNLKTSMQNLKRDELAIKTFNNTSLVIVNKLNTIEITGESDLNAIVVDGKEAGFLLLGKANVQHELDAQLDLATIHSEHHILLDEEFAANVIQNQKSVTIRVDNQALAGLQKAVHSIEPEFTLTNGKLAGNVTIDLEALTGAGKFDLAQLSAQYKEFGFKQLSTASAFTLDSAGLQLAGANLTLASADVGVAITDLDADMKIIDSQINLTQVTGKLLGGSFALDQLWLDQREQHTEVQIAHIDLAKLVELQQQSGIQVKGEIGGTLPMVLSEQGVRITGGKISSYGPGTLRIVNNPAFESIKAQQAELAYLQNLDFAKLSSHVRLENDGWLFLDFSILGKNPEFAQAINFNYSHEENILTLLRSLRLTDSVQSQIEQKIQQGGEK